MKNIILIIILALLATSGFAAESDSLNTDKTSITQLLPRTYSTITFSPGLNIRSGAESIIGINHGLAIANDRTIGTKWFSEKTIPGKAGGLVCRFSKYLFLDMPINYFSEVVAHEYFGHGARYRELDVNNIDYGFDAPPPYGDGGGHASTNIEANTITKHELIAIYIGGFEVQEKINRKLNLRFMSKKEIHYQESILYFESFKIMFDYVQKTNNDFSDRKDPAEYVRLLNSNAGITNPDSFKMDLKYLKSHYYINYANPFLLYSVYSVFKTYFWDGNSATSVPMIHTKNFDYLPSLRATFTPFGLEYHLENYFRFKGKTALIDIRLGDQKFFNSWGGLGILVQNFYEHKRYALDVDLNLWKQPGIEIGRENATLKGDGVGASLSLRGHYDFSDSSHPISIFVELGYKSAGFIEGFDLDASPIILFGFGYRN